MVILPPRNDSPFVYPPPHRQKNGSNYVLFLFFFYVRTAKVRLQILKMENDKGRKRKRKADAERYNEALCPLKSYFRGSG